DTNGGIVQSGAVSGLEDLHGGLSEPLSVMAGIRDKDCSLVGIEMVLGGMLGGHTLRLARPWFRGVGKPLDRPSIGRVPAGRAFARRKTVGIIGRQMGGIVLAGSIPLPPVVLRNFARVRIGCGHAAHSSQACQN